MNLAKKKQNAIEKTQMQQEAFSKDFGDVQLEKLSNTRVKKGKELSIAENTVEDF